MEVKSTDFALIQISYFLQGLFLGLSHSVLEIIVHEENGIKFMDIFLNPLDEKMMVNFILRIIQTNKLNI